MQFAIPYFIFFSLNSVVVSLLSLVLRNYLNYSATQVGILMSLYELAGIVFPLLLSQVFAKKGKLGHCLIIFAIVMTVVPAPLIRTSGFFLTVFFIMIYAVGYKGCIPFYDSIVNDYIDNDKQRYGYIRCWGSIGFVVGNLALQYFCHFDSVYIKSHITEIILWFVVPAVLYTISIAVIPGAAFGTAKKKLVEAKSKVESSKDNATKDESSSDGAKCIADTSILQENEIDENKKSVFLDVFSRYPKIFYLVLFVIFTGFMGLVPSNVYIAMYAQEFLHSDKVALLSAIHGLCETPFLFFSGKIINKFGSRKVVIFSAFVVAIRMFTFVLIPNLTGAIIAQCMNSVTFGLFHPACIMFVTENAPDRKSTVVGMAMYSNIAVGLANVIGNAIGGLVIDMFGYKALFAGFGCVPLLGILIYFLLKKSCLRK
ncbi:MAG: MFS transporter [Treponema sp.]